MMKNRILLFVLFFVVAFSNNAQAQRQKIALFAPLYLDSAFDASGNYRFSSSFPKFLNPGLEFYQGAQAAFDSLSKVGAPLEVHIYDSRARFRSLSQQVNSPELQDVDLFIGHTNSNETRILADAAARRKIPFVSATLPNDAGITNNPYYVVLNSTLRTHAENLYRYLQKNHSLDRIVVLRKGGTQEDQLKEYFEEAAKTTASVPLKMQFVDIGSEWTFNRLTSALDSTRKTVCIAGSLDENFGLNLAQSLAEVSNDYPVTLIGMPTWDGLNLARSEFKGLEMVYTTPFYYGRPSALSAKITNEFMARVEGRPTDMYYRGYETALRFALLLLDTKQDMASNLTRKGNYIFTQFDIQPVFLNKQNMTLDYFENKKLYFVKVYNGTKTVQ
ncbi:MAG TPA: ABC transporter substrate-binding protein [Flavisolibacter sp.]|nr:ABC transporter substrate-binding protein [Flavisolibacter sp.]